MSATLLLELVLDRSTNPAGYRAIIIASASTNLLQGLRREPNRNQLGELGPAAATGTCGSWFSGLGVELDFFGASHLPLSHRSSRYRSAGERPPRSIRSADTYADLANQVERWDDQHATGDLGDHQPMRRRLRRIEERIRAPDVVDVIDTEAGVLDEVGGLVNSISNGSSSSS